ncbi:MAG: DNA polymerase III subunit delta, partial [Bacilli bacterium]
MVYVLYGTIDFLINKQIKKILNTNIITDINITNYDLTNDYLTSIINDADTMSLFSNKKAIIVNNSYIFTGATKKNNEQNISVLEAYLNNINPDTILIFIVNNEKLDDRKKIVKLIKKVATVLEYNNTDINKLVLSFCDDYIITPDTIKFLISRVGDNINLLSNEIDKIKIYKDNEKCITNQDIELLTSKYEEINNFKLIDAIIAKNKALAITLYNQRLKLNEEPIAIVIALANQIRIMYQVKALYALGHTEHDIASIINIHPYRVKLAANTKYDLKILL